MQQCLQLLCKRTSSQVLMTACWAAQPADVTRKTAMFAEHSMLGQGTDQGCSDIGTFGPYNTTFCCIMGSSACAQGITSSATQPPGKQGHVHCRSTAAELRIVAATNVAKYQQTLLHQCGLVALENCRTSMLQALNLDEFFHVSSTLLHFCKLVF